VLKDVTFTFIKYKILCDYMFNGFRSYIYIYIYIT